MYGAKDSKTKYLKTRAILPHSKDDKFKSFYDIFQKGYLRYGK